MQKKEVIRALDHLARSSLTIKKINLDNIIQETGTNWVIGTPTAVSKDSPGFSHSLQISYNNGPKNPQDEKYHYHTDSIEECYIVLKGDITLKIDGKTDYQLFKNEAIRVPPYRCHKIIEFSNDVSYLTIRAPISDDRKTVVCDE